MGTQSIPDLQYIVQIGEYFNVSLDYLIKGEEITLAEVSKQEKEDECDKKSNYVIGYKWLFVLGLVLMVVSMVGMMTFAVLNLFFLSGIGCAGWGIFKQQHPTKSILTKSNQIQIDTAII